MIQHKDWYELNKTVKEGAREMSPAFTFRVPDGGFLQYSNDGGEHIAIRNTKPYGSLSDVAYGGEPERLHLLKVSEKGNDYTDFIVPEDTISLGAISLGTGRMNVDLLVPVYENVGRAIRDISREARIKELGLSDFAIERANGDVVFVPPMEFEAGQSDPVELVDGLAESMHEGLKSVFKPEEISVLHASLQNN